jgi:hypothetical protein
MYTATLRCGTVLTYEAKSFLPATGEVVPCRRHGFCVVEGSGGAKGGSCLRDARRAKRKSPDELLEWLRGRSVTTIHALRRHRFTLRIITAAERDGLVTVDLETGSVTVLAPQARAACDEQVLFVRDHATAVG